MRDHVAPTHELRYYRSQMRTRSSAMALAALLILPTLIAAQDRLKLMPGYDGAQRVARDAPSAIAGAVTDVAWIDAGTFEYDRNGKRHRYDLWSGRDTDADPATAAAAGRGGRGAFVGGPDRGRQFESAT